MPLTKLEKLIDVGTKLAEELKQSKPTKRAAEPKKEAPKSKKPKKSDEEGGDAVEKLVGIRHGSSGLEYQVQWTGSKKELTWEPEDNILDDDLIDECEETQQQAIYGEAELKSGMKVEVCDGHGRLQHTLHT